MASVVSGLFALGLFLPPAVVAIGLMLLAWPGGHARREAIPIGTRAPAR
jgi:hypothetical protein